VVLRALAGAICGSLLAAGSASAQLLGLPANLVSLPTEPASRTFATVDYGKTAAVKDDRPGTTQWRVVGGVHDPPFNWRGTGNCCENFPIAGPDGRLYDIGGSWINYSDDDGKTWMSVRPPELLINGEGAMALAPNGDVLGLTWDLYSGDHAVSYKYTAATKQWSTLDVPIHLPIYDRPWLEVIPGPTTVNGQTVPYVSFVQGGTGLKEPWLYSTDGLTYVHSVTRVLDLLNAAPVDGPLQVAADPGLDWNQPSTNGLVTPLGRGAALAAPYPPVTMSWSLFDPSSFTWHPFTFSGGTVPEGLYLADSGGRLHRVIGAANQVDYAISPDGGKTWSKTIVKLPKGDDIENIDFRANKAVGIAAVGIHAHNGNTDNDVDLLYKLDITTNQPRVTRQYQLSRNDVNASSGIGQAIRFDFEALAILPDGRVAMPMLDSTTITHSLSMGDAPGPNLAIEVATALSGKDAVLPRLRVSLKVVRRGSKLVFSGTVKPKVPRRPVSIQQRSGSKWKTVARGRTTSSSTFRISKKLRARKSARFRAVVTGDPAHRSGRSKTAAVRGR
jgi:hypothetical protein